MVVARYLSNRGGVCVRRMVALEGSNVDSVCLGCWSDNDRVFFNLPTYSDLTSGKSTRPCYLLSVRLIVKIRYA